MLIQIVCGVGDTLVPMQWLIQELNYFVVWIQIMLFNLDEYFAQGLMSYFDVQWPYDTEVFNIIYIKNILTLD